MMNRRHLLYAAGGLLAMPSLALAQRGSPGLSTSDDAPNTRRPFSTLWAGKAPGGGGPSGELMVGRGGAVSNVAIPGLTVYRPARPNGAAVLVAAGGGYKRIELGTEADPAARWLSAHGITAYVLTYRLPGEGWHDGPLAPLQDAQRAIRLIRVKAHGPVGVLGFSAGGHLLGLAATRSGFASYRPQDALDGAPAQVDEAALIYPVVTLEPPFDHTSTRMQLIGSHPSPSESADWSIQTHVRDRCPPMFLVQAEDDPISKIANTAILAEACRAAGVPVERHVLPRGGHGFGMGRPGSPTGAWPRWYETWLSAQGVRA